MGSQSRNMLVINKIGGLSTRFVFGSYFSCFTAFLFILPLLNVVAPALVEFFSMFFNLTLCVCVSFTGQEALNEYLKTKAVTIEY